jgi:hypothetical protein
MSIGRVHRPPIEHKPDVWAGGFDDHNIRHDDQPDIPVTVRIRSDGTKGDHNGTHRTVDAQPCQCGARRPAVDVCVAGDVRRREVTCYLNDPHPGVECGPPVPARTPTGVKARAVGDLPTWLAVNRHSAWRVPHL